MKRTVAVVALSTILAVLSITLGRRARIFRGASSIGYVSMQRILSESPQDKAGAARIQAMQQQKASELMVMQQALEAIRGQIRQDALAPGSSRSQMERREQQQRTELERATVQAQSELQSLQRQFQNELRTRLTPILEEVSRMRNVQVILNEDTAVVWSAPGFDLTTAVIDRLKAGAPERAPKQ